MHANEQAEEENYANSSGYTGISEHERTPASMEFGGPEGDRTPDLRIANAALSQLSYTPLKRRRILLSAI